MQVKERPEAVSQIIRRNAAEANLAGPETIERSDDRLVSLREYLLNHMAFDKAKGTAYLGWALATVADLMKVGAWREAEATVLLCLAAIEQVTLDEGRWQVAWLFTHLPEPPWQRISRRPPQGALRPFTRLIPASWAAAAASYVRDMATLTELKKKAKAAPGGRGGEGEDA